MWDSYEFIAIGNCPTLFNRPRFRRILKWAGVGVCVLYVAIFVPHRLPYAPPLIGFVLATGYLWWCDSNWSERRSWKYAGLAASGVVFIAWAASTQWKFGTSAGGNVVVFADGVAFLFLGINQTYDEASPGFQVLRQGGNGFCMPEKFALAMWGMRFGILPLWIPFLIVLVPTLVLFWRERRGVRPCRCQSCSYNLTGNTSGVCPECGTPILDELSRRVKS